MSALGATVRHGLIRARATLTTPSALVVVLFTGAITCLWTRSAEQMNGPLTSLSDQVAPILFSYLAALWMRGVVAGRVTGAASGFGLWVEAMPNLPVSWRARCVAEAVVALALAGRPRRESGFAWPSVFVGGQFSRAARPGPQALGRDQWLRPLRLAALVAGPVALVEVGVLALITAGLATADILDWVQPLLFMALAVTTLFPVGLSLSTAGAGRLLGPTEGGFGRAWSTLPVRPRAVVRGLFLHGVVSGTVLWLVVLGASMTSSLVVEGVAQPNRILLSMAGLIPCLAGYLTCAAVGAQARALVALAVAPLALVMLPVATIGDSPVIAELGLFGLALVGGGPALLLLLQPAHAQ